MSDTKLCEWSGKSTKGWPRQAASDGRTAYVKCPCGRWVKEKANSTAPAHL